MPRVEDRKVRRDDLMRGHEAAKVLGVTRPTVLAMIARGEIGSVTVAGLVFAVRADVERAAVEREAARLAKAS